MKRQIRRCVFETNSSSMHSLSVIGSDRMSTLHDEDGVIFVKYGEFGCGYRDLENPIDKLSYLVTQYQNNDDMIKTIKDAVFNYTGCKLNIIGLNGYYKTGYIDHQSVGMICKYISDEQSIIDIVFNDKNVIIIDNDNY